MDFAVASRTGAFAYSVYRGGRYEIRMLEPAGALAGRAVNVPAGFTAADPTAPERSLSSIVSHL